MIALLLALAPAQGQQYSFPSTAAHYEHWYVTAYRDDGGVDWDCGDLFYDGHRGSDFGGGSFAGMDEGRDITAAATGEVVYTHDGEFDRCTTGDCYGGGGFGNHVQIRHASGQQTTYGHMKQFSVAVTVGQIVQCGDFLGQMGSSGYSTGPHLHFAVNDVYGSSADPFEGPCDAAAEPSHWMDQGGWDELPELICDGPTAPCAATDRFSCGTVLDTRNDAPGSTQEHAYYGCSEFVYSGPELVWEFATDRDEPVTIDLSGLSGDLDLYALDSDSCDGTGCLASSTNGDLSDEQVVFDAVAGTTYWVLVDGWEGAVTDLHLEVGCEGQLPDPATTDTGTVPKDTDTPGTSGTTSGDDDDGATLVPEKSGGCGCATGSGTVVWWLPFLLVGVRRARSV